jgi:hypothetical protein
MASNNLWPLCFIRTLLRGCSIYEWLAKLLSKADSVPANISEAPSTFCDIAHALAERAAQRNGSAKRGGGGPPFAVKVHPNAELLTLGSSAAYT